MSHVSAGLFVFRVDASLEIGSGHVMRCLALADGLKSVGKRCVFVSRVLSGNHCDMIAARGYEIRRLVAPDASPCRPETPAQYADWARVPSQQDAAETREVLTELRPDWVVIDHYAFDTRWQATAVPRSTQVLWIDDLANRPLDADLLVNANLGVRAAAYDGLLPTHATLLLGPEYNMLRPAFAEGRAEILAGRQVRSLRRVLVTMGGIDLPNASAQVLDALAALPNAPELEVDVVLGSRAPALEVLRAKLSTLPFSCRLGVDVPDMARLMAEADLAIGAIGGTAWERCALGLPAIMLSIADNQIPGARALHAAGAARYIGDVRGTDWHRALAVEFERLSDASALAALSDAAAEVCDGDGLARIIAEIVHSPLAHRPAQASDSRRIWEWRYGKGEESFFRNAKKPSYADHNAWFLRALANPNLHMDVLTLGPLPIGYIRLDRESGDRALLSICLSPSQRGKKRSVAALRIGHASAHALGYAELIAEVHEENTASRRLFEAAGYIEIGRDGAFHLLRYRLARGGEDAKG